MAEAVSGPTEEVVSTDPLEAKFTFFAEDDALTLTLDDDLAVVDVTRRPASEFDGEARPRS